MIRTGLLGGSFNPAHGGHRTLSLRAMKALALNEIWWLVSPGNPLKPRETMAPLSARLRSARRMARRSPIRATAIEAKLQTRYTYDTLRALVRRYPRRRFIWIMGADNLEQFHRWHNWRKIAAMMPVAVIARPGYDMRSRRARAAQWLRRFVRPAPCACHWIEWRPASVMFLRFPPDVRSATAVRRAGVNWFVDNGAKDRL